MSNVILLKPISNTVDITTEIIKRCELILQNDEEYKNLQKDGIDFKSIIPYEDPTNNNEPCFQANQVFRFINPKESHVRRKLKESFILNKHYFKAKITNDNKTPDNILTRKGLMRAMNIGKTKLAETFQDYVFDLLDGLWKREREVMEREMKNTEKALMETNKKLLLEEELRKAMDIELCNVTNKKIEDFGKLTYLKSTMINGKKSKDIELEILREKYMKPFKMYSVNIGLVKQHYLKLKKFSKKKIRKTISKTSSKKTGSKEVIKYEFAKHGLSDDNGDSDSCNDEKTECIESSNHIAYDSVYGELDDDLDIVEYYGFKSINLEFLKESYETEFYIYLQATTEKKDASNPIDNNPNFHFIGNLYMLDKEQYTRMMHIIIFGEIIERQELPDVPKILENETAEYKNNREKLQRLHKIIANNNTKLDSYDDLTDDGFKLFTIEKKKIIKITGKQLMDARILSFEQTKPASNRRTRSK